MAQHVPKSTSANSLCGSRSSFKACTARSSARWSNWKRATTTETSRPCCKSTASPTPPIPLRLPLKPLQSTLQPPQLQRTNDDRTTGHQRRYQRAGSFGARAPRGPRGPSGPAARRAPRASADSHTNARGASQGRAVERIRAFNARWFGCAGLAVFPDPAAFH